MHSGSRSCCRISTLALFTFGIGYRTRLSNAVVLLLNSYLYWVMSMSCPAPRTWRACC